MERGDLLSDRCSSKLLQPVLPSALRWSLFMPFICTLLLRHLPRKRQHCLLTGVWCRWGFSKRWLRTTASVKNIDFRVANSFLFSRSRIRPWWFRFRYGHEIYPPKLPKSRRSWITIKSRTRAEAFYFCHTHSFISAHSFVQHYAQNRAVAVGVPPFGIPPCWHSARKCVRHSAHLAFRPPPILAGLSIGLSIFWPSLFDTVKFYRPSLSCKPLSLFFLFSSHVGVWAA